MHTVRVQDEHGHLRAAFRRGDHREVLARTVDSLAGSYPAALTPLVVASLGWLDRLEEARDLYRRRRAHLTVETRVEARFYLALAHCRRGEHRVARRLVCRNRAALAGRPRQRVAFHTWQGMAFLAFFEGRFTDAARLGRRSLLACCRARYPFGKVLALDLLGHADIRTGRVRRGLMLLARAIAVAEQLGNGGLATAIRCSLATYRAQHGIAPDLALRELEQLRAGGPVHDSYTRAVVVLELVRQHALRGGMAAARAALDEAAGLALASGVRQLEVLLCARRALVEQLAGNLEVARAVLDSGLALLDVTVERDLACHLRAFRCALAAAEGNAPPPEEQASGSTACCALGARMARRGRGVPSLTGEDPLGDLLDDVALARAHAGERIVAGGWYGLLPRLWRLTPGARCLVLETAPRRLWLVDRGEVLRRERVTPALHAALVQLAQGWCDKEALIGHLWGYPRYHPLRHDRLVYHLVARLRRLLGSRGHWLEQYHGRYRLTVPLYRPAGRVAPARSSHGQADTSDAPVDGALHPRQQVLLSHIDRSGQAVDNATVRALLGVSPATARRDLRALAERGLVYRAGRGRAITYARKGPGEP
jgi:hypothetical protein